MSLPDDYTRYPSLRAGMDHDRYDYSQLHARPPITWPKRPVDADAPRVALWLTIALEHFPLAPTHPELRPQGPTRFKARGDMVTPYPDLRHFTLRDYGNRVGVYRVLELLDRLQLPASFAVNAAVAERYPALVDQLARRAGSELIAYGYDMSALHHGGLTKTDERALIRKSLAAVRAASRQPVRGWLSPGRSQSHQTLDLLAAEGVDYVGDWINDELPYPLRAGGRELWAMPLGHELSDLQIIHHYQDDADQLADQLIDAHAFLDDEARRRGGRVLAITIHPWLSGQAHRVGALARALEHICAQPGVWPVNGAELLTAFQRAPTRPLTRRGADST